MAVLQQTVFTKLRSVLDLAYWVCRTHLKGLQYTSLIITVNLQVILYHFRYSVRTLQQYASISPALCYCSTFYFYMLQTTNYFYFDNELYFKNFKMRKMSFTFMCIFTLWCSSFFFFWYNPHFHLVSFSFCLMRFLTHFLLGRYVGNKFSQFWLSPKKSLFHFHL